MAASTVVPYPPGVEVVAKAKRRSFTAEYKHRILQQADACSQPGEVAALLRREGLYSSHLSVWRAARRHGELSGLAARKRGPVSRKDPAAARIAELERQLRRSEARAQRAEAMVEFQKKVSELLGITLQADPEEKS